MGCAGATRRPCQRHWGGPAAPALRTSKELHPGLSCVWPLAHPGSCGPRSHFQAASWSLSRGLERWGCLLKAMLWPGRESRPDPGVSASKIWTPGSLPTPAVNRFSAALAEVESFRLKGRGRLSQSPWAPWKGRWAKADSETPGLCPGRRATADGDSPSPSCSLLSSRVTVVSPSSLLGKEGSSKLADAEVLTPQGATPPRPGIRCGEGVLDTTSRTLQILRDGAPRASNRVPACLSQPLRRGLESGPHGPVCVGQQGLGSRGEATERRGARKPFGREVGGAEPEAAEREAAAHPAFTACPRRPGQLSYFVFSRNL